MEMEAKRRAPRLKNANALAQNPVQRRLLAMRRRLGLSVDSCAAYLGTPTHTLIKWCNGTREPQAAVERLLEVLEMIEKEAPHLHRRLLGQPDE